MPSSNINKIVSTNLNLKPWLLSKNTNEIVNTCIQKIYKQMPKNLNKSVKLASPRPENKAPIRSFRTQDTAEPVGISITAAQAVPFKKNPRSCVAVPVKNAKVNNDAFMNSAMANKKLLKSPNYKIYGQRRFGSSASSSNASLFRRSDERRKNKLNNALLKNLTRSFGLQSLSSQSPLGKTDMSRYFVPARNQHMEVKYCSLPRAAQIADAIQRDLMTVDTAVKNRIAPLNRNKFAKLKMECQTDSHDPMRGWKHPQSPEALLTYPNENTANVSLQEQQRRNKTITEYKQFRNLRQLEANAELKIGSGLSIRTTRNRQRVSDVYNQLSKETLPSRFNQHAAARLRPQITHRSSVAEEPIDIDEMIPPQLPSPRSKTIDPEESHVGYYDSFLKPSSEPSPSQPSALQVASACVSSELNAASAAIPTPGGTTTSSRYNRSSYYGNNVRRY